MREQDKHNILHNIGDASSIFLANTVLTIAFLSRQKTHNKHAAYRRHQRQRSIEHTVLNITRLSD